MPEDGITGAGQGALLPGDEGCSLHLVPEDDTGLDGLGGGGSKGVGGTVARYIALLGPHCWKVTDNGQQG